MPGGRPHLALRRAAAHLICAFSLIVLTHPSLAQTDPLGGRDRFPEFRNLSGLAGGGYGVDRQGYPSLSGPVALSTPVAQVLGHSHVYLTAERTSLKNQPEFSNQLTNGTVCATYGATFGQANVALTDMVITARGKQVFSVQAQLIPRDRSGFVFSVGCQDFLWGGGGSSGLGLPGDTKSSRSAFGVATYQVPCGLPLYVSAGIGTRRFSQGFCSISAQLAKPLRAYVEHDGFGLNTGVLLSSRLGTGRSSAELGFRLSLVQQRWISLGGTLGF